MNARMKLRPSRGNALVLALGSTTTLVIAGGTLLVAVTQERIATEQSVVNAQARDASVSGVEDALALLDVDPDYSGSYPLAMGGPRADVTISWWGDDLLDNDEDGAVDEADEADYRAIVSIGSANVVAGSGGLALELPTRRALHRTEVVVQRYSLDLAAQQALYVDDAAAAFDFDGASFLLSGIDTNLDDGAGPGVALPGIGTVGDPAAILAQLDPSQLAQVIGIGGCGSVGTVADIDLAGTMSTLATAATLQWNGADEHHSGAIGDLACQVAVVAHASGNLEIDGATTGCGVLLVDGDLRIDADFDYAGLIYVAGAVRFHGAGAMRLRGAIYTLGAMAGGDDVEIDGAVDLRYSSEAIGLVSTQLADRYSIVSWQQR